MGVWGGGAAGGGPGEACWEREKHARSQDRSGALLSGGAGAGGEERAHLRKGPGQGWWLLRNSAVDKWSISEAELTDLVTGFSDRL